MLLIHLLRSSINVNLWLLKAFVEFLWGGMVEWGGMHTHFRVQPNFSVEVMLRCVVIGVVTISITKQALPYLLDLISLTFSTLARELKFGTYTH